MLEKIREKIKKMDEAGEISPRSPVKALLLSICPGLGQQYAGDIKRGITLYVSLIIASWLAAMLYAFMGSRISIIFLFVPFAGFAFVAIDAYLLARRQPDEYRLRWFNRGWIYFAVFAALLVTVNPLMDRVVGRTVIRGFFVSTESMAPTVLKHDLVVINKLYAAATPQRGDVVLIMFSRGKASSNLTTVMDDQLIRRVIALPGDTVEVRERDVMVNGKRLEEPYALYDAPGSHIKEIGSFGPEKVPEGQYFVLGDNRNHSLDSRFLGFIPGEKIGGKATKIFWSWNFEDGRIKWERTGMRIR